MSEVGNEADVVPSTSVQPDRFSPSVALTILLVLTALAFAPTLRNGFTSWDDNETLWQNPDFSPPTLAGVSRYWHRPHMALYVPVTYTAWGALAAIAFDDSSDAVARGVRLNPFVFHAASLIAHLASVALVFAILRTLGLSTIASFFGAAVFGLHPVQVEPVAWASGLKDVLCGMFSLAAVWQYIRFAKESRHRAATYWLATLLFVLALLSKPTAMITPLIALAIDWWILRRDARRIFISLAPWFALSLACAIVAKFVQNVSGDASAALPLWDRPFLAATSLVLYLARLGVPFRLGIDYGQTPSVIRDSLTFWFAWIIPFALGIVLWMNRRREPLLWVAGIVFVVGVLPVLGFVPFLFQQYSNVADHYLYLSMFAVALAVAVFVQRFPTRGTTLLLGAILVALAIRSFIQTHMWRDDRTLFSHALAVNPASWVSHSHLGSVLSSAGDSGEAAQEFVRATQLNPDFAEAHFNLGNLYLRSGQLEQAQACFENAVRVRPTFAEAQYHLGVVLAMRGRHADAIKHFQQALAAKPTFEAAAQAIERSRAKLLSSSRPTGAIAP